jgi:hypothetical protein
MQHVHVKRKEMTMTPSLNELRTNPAAFEARARRARSEALYNIFLRLLSRLSSQPDESLGRPHAFGQGQWG